MKPMETLDGELFFPESPRWHQGCLWVSDIAQRTVYRYDADGRKHAVAVFDDDQSGLGWLPSGELLAVTMRPRKLVRVADDGFFEVADLSAIEPFMTNDLAVASDGTAFVTRFGFDPWAGGDMQGVRVIRVRPDGTVSLIGGDVVVPNGIALSGDERTLFIAESGAARISAIDDPLADTPAGTRLVCKLPVSDAPGVRFAAPDGICLDSAGGIWAADPPGHRVVRVDDAGSVSDVLEFPAEERPVAVALGGEERTTLFVAVSTTAGLDAPRIKPTGRIDFTTVAIPGL
jgi:sugar lactone lactonase YvrE